MMFWRAGVPMVALIFVAACGGGNAASLLAKPPNFDPKGQAKCSVEKSQAKPLIVEWPSADRGELEAQARSRGVVVVRYQGCEMQVLGGCTTPVDYAYAAITRKKDHVAMRDADDLYANVPVGAAKLEAQLEKSGELDVDMTMVGRWEAGRRHILPDELQGDCSGATHVVSALTVGSFTFASGANAMVGGGVSMLGAGGGATSTAKRETLNADGDEASCAKAALDDKVPPPQCGAVIRIEVAPIGDASTSIAAQTQAGIRLRDIEGLADSKNPADQARARALLEARVFGGPGHLEEMAIRQSANVLRDLCMKQGDPKCVDEIGALLGKLVAKIDFSFVDDLEKFFVPVSWTFMVDGAVQYNQTFGDRDPVSRHLPVFMGSVPLGPHTAAATCTFRSPGRRYTFTVEARHDFKLLVGRDLGLELHLSEPAESARGPVENRAHLSWIERIGDSQTQFSTGLDRIETHVDQAAAAEPVP